MKRIEIFSLFPIDREIKRWKKQFTNLNIDWVNEPTADCYSIMKLTKLTCNWPEVMFKGIYRGAVESRTTKKYNIDNVFWTSAMETKLQELNKEEENGVNLGTNLGQNIK